MSTSTYFDSPQWWVGRCSGCDSDRHGWCRTPDCEGEWVPTKQHDLPACLAAVDRAHAIGPILRSQHNSLPIAGETYDHVYGEFS